MQGLVVFPMADNCLCKSAIVAVRDALLVVRVALLFTSAAKMSFSVVAALAREMKYPSSSAFDSCGIPTSFVLSL